MTNYQSETLTELKSKLLRQISDRQNEIAVLGLITYNPKADGTERAKFESNFALRGLGERYKNCWGESRPWITLDRRLDRDGRTNCIDIAVAPLSDTEAVKAGLTGKTEHVDGRYFFPDVAPNTDHLDKDSSAKAFVDLIHGEIIPSLERKVSELQNELTRIEDFFAEAVRMADMFKEFKDKYKDTERLHWFASYDILKKLEYLASA